MVKRLSNTNQNNNALTNVPTPTNSGDAANKQYVDDVFAEESPNNLYVSTVAPSSPNPDDVWVDTSSDLGPVDLSGSMGVAVHGTNASYARPTGYAAITWIGSVQPTNATANDIWYNG